MGLGTSQMSRLWVAAVATLVGDGLIFLTIILNASTLFDYNGKVTGPVPISAPGAIILVELALLGFAVGYLLWKVWRARTPGCFRLWHLIPMAIAITAPILGILIPIVRIIEASF